MGCDWGVWAAIAVVTGHPVVCAVSTSNNPSPPAPRTQPLTQVCLFGANEVSLRDAVRGGASDAELGAVISAAVDNKRAAHAGMEVLAVTQNRPMITIGG
jgi:hypothetical protein